MAEHAADIRPSRPAPIGPRAFDPSVDLVDESEERWNLLCLHFSGTLSPTALAQGLRRVGSATALLNLEPDALAERAGVTAQAAADLLRRCGEDDLRIAVAEECRRLDTGPERIVGLRDAEYPALLRLLPDPPVALWVHGALRPEDGLAAAILGASRCDDSGRRQAEQFAGFASESGITVVNGGEQGIDAIALTAALDRDGRAVVGLGSGLRAHGRRLQQLYDRVAEHGAVLSAVPLPRRPGPVNQVVGDQLVIGMTLVTLIVQSGLNGGALIAARLAALAGREVAALPGPIDAPASAGSNALLAKGGARMTLAPRDLIRAARETARRLAEDLGRRHWLSGERPGVLPFGSLDRHDRALLRELDDTPTEHEIKAWADELDLPGDLRRRLSRLEIMGLIDRAGQRYHRVHAE